MEYIEKQNEEVWGQASQKEFPWTQLVDELVVSHFKFEGLRPFQRQIINACFSKKDVMALIPTSGGKSLPF